MMPLLPSATKIDRRELLKWFLSSAFVFSEEEDDDEEESIELFEERFGAKSFFVIRWKKRIR